MKFAILINSSPYQSQAGETAFRFIEAALDGGHEVVRVFFYCDGIYHAMRFMSPPDDEVQVTERWSQMAKMHGIDLVVCISAAQRRGLLSSDEANRRQKRDNDVADGFRISGLGQLVEATLLADRFMVFGR